eukprot:gene10083-10238_t
MSFHTWLKGHFRLDAQDLAEISSTIAVPGLQDLDDIDVLSLLQDEDMPNAVDVQLPVSAVGSPFDELSALLDQPIELAFNNSSGPSPGTVPAVYNEDDAAADAGRDKKSGGPKRYRKPSDAQRAAHRRFRQRRKEQARALDQLVVSAGAAQARDAGVGLDDSPWVKAGSIQNFSAKLEKLLPAGRGDLSRSQAALPTDMQGALATLQALIKAFCAEVMQLLLQVGAETHVTGAWLNVYQLSTAAAARFGQHQQVQGEFRAFAISNRISLYRLQTLNIETGLLGAQPPPGHFKKLAQLLVNRQALAARDDNC